MSKETRRQPENNAKGHRRSHFGGSRPEPEKLDPTPIALPVGYGLPESLEDKIARYVHQAMAIQRGEEPESWEEANDFDFEADDDLLDLSPYELPEMSEEELYGNPFSPEKTGSEFTELAESLEKEKEGSTPPQPSETPSGASDSA